MEKKFFKNDAILSKWYLGDTYHVAIGQGDMLTTPLQVALWTATIANNGTGFKPHLVKKITDSAGKVVKEFKPELLINLGAKQENIDIVKQGMKETISYGSGKQLSGLKISSAGKTGTSQFDGADPTKTHAWFTAFAPYENPQIVITVLAEAGGEGHRAAVPIVNKTLEWWQENRYNK
jgi:penicillin-binding protein 2